MGASVMIFGERSKIYFAKTSSTGPEQWAVFVRINEPNYGAALWMPVLE